MTQVRESPIAGQWYKGKSEDLKQQIENCFLNQKYGIGKLPNSPDKPKNNLLGVISPHAGYRYSGPIASHSYYTLKQYLPDIDIAIVLGPNHRGFGAPIAFYPSGKWKFPMGDLSVSQELINFTKDYNFGKISELVEFDETAHVEEHSIDIQFPFLQYIYDDFDIFPICLSNQALDPVGIELGKFLQNIVNYFNDFNIAIIASTDLSHEYNYDILSKNDLKLVEFIEKMNTSDLDDFRVKNSVTMCGYGPVYSLLEYANKYDGSKLEKLRYSNSREITGKKGGYTVGYLSAKIIQ